MLSARLPQPTADAVEAWAIAHDTTRSDAIRRLVELGLASSSSQSDRRLDEALANTFPASDPIEAEEPGTGARRARTAVNRARRRK